MLPRETGVYSYTARPILVLLRVNQKHSELTSVQNQILARGMLKTLVVLPRVHRVLPGRNYSHLTTVRLLERMTTREGGGDTGNPTTDSKHNGRPRSARALCRILPPSFCDVA